MASNAPMDHSQPGFYGTPADSNSADSTPADSNSAIGNLALTQMIAALMQPSGVQTQLPAAQDIQTLQREKEFLEKQLELEKLKQQIAQLQTQVSQQAAPAKAPPAKAAKAAKAASANGTNLDLGRNSTEKTRTYDEEGCAKGSLRGFYLESKNPDGTKVFIARGMPFPRNFCMHERSAGPDMRYRCRMDPGRCKFIHLDGHAKLLANREKSKEAPHGTTEENGDEEGC